MNISLKKYYQLMIEDSSSGFKEALLKAKGDYYLNKYKEFNNQFDKKLRFNERVQLLIHMILVLFILAGFSDVITSGNVTILLKEQTDIVSNMILNQWNWITLKAFVLILINKYVFSSLINSKYKNKIKEDKEIFYQKTKNDIFKDDLKEYYELSKYNHKKIEKKLNKAKRMNVEIDEIDEFIKGVFLMKKNQNKNRIKIDLIKSYSNEK